MDLVELHGGPWDGWRVFEEQFSRNGVVELAGHTMQSFRKPVVVTSGKGRRRQGDVYHFLDTPLVAEHTCIIDAQKYAIYEANKAFWEPKRDDE